MGHLKKLSGTFLTGFLVATGALAQQDIVSFSSPGTTVIDPNSFTVGYEFSVTTPVTVDGLSVFTVYPGTGYNAVAPVGLWNASQTELGSLNILTGDAAPLTTDLSFRYQLFPTPIVLPIGTYYVGAYIQGSGSGENVPLTYDVNGLNSIPGITYVSPQVAFGSSLAFPDEDVSGLFPTGIFGGNVVVDPSLVPEPKPTLLLVAGLIALGLLGPFRAGQLHR